MSWLFPFGRRAPTHPQPALIETPPVAPQRGQVDEIPDPHPPDAPMAAGAAWCDRFPGSARLEDLAPPFRERAERFVAHLVALGCRIEVASTLRPEPRAWLMRMAWDVVHGFVEYDDVPIRRDISIVWTLGGALEMVRAYRLRARPSLTSRHIHGLALDMRVHDWMGSDESLYQLGAEFGVYHLPGDPVHWSVDGH